MLSVLNVFLSLLVVSPRAGAQATTKIDRKDFGINWSKVIDGGGLMVGDEVAISIDVEATTQ